MKTTKPLQTIETPFVGAIKHDKEGNPIVVLTPDGWVDLKVAPVKKFSEVVKQSRSATKLQGSDSSLISIMKG